MRPSADRHRFALGAALSGAVALLLATLLALIWLARSEGVRRSLDIWQILERATLQAGLTTVLSLLIGIAMAWALNRLRFPGRSLLVGLLSAALVTPGLVVAVGVLSVWGRAGWLNQLLAPLGWQSPSIFGLGGIVYAHLILDATFAAAVLLPRLDDLPRTRLRLGQSLRLSSFDRFRVIDWPAMRPALPGLGAVIFLLAFTSFPIVLTLGGGPANQTLEVAIYAAVRLDFDLGAAVQLALVQLLISAALIVPATAFAPVAVAGGIARQMRWAEPALVTGLGVFILLTTGLGFGLPLLTVIWDGVQVGALFQQQAFWTAAGTSLGVGIGSAITALLLGLTVALARTAAPNRAGNMLVSAPALAYLAMPGVTLALGFFLASRALGIGASVAAPVVLILANAMLTLPYAIATLTPAIAAIDRRYGKLATSLRLTALQRWRSIEYPQLGREIGLVMAMGFCFSLGDLSVIALFGTQDFSTLPWLMNRALGAYRTNDAATIAAILLVLSTLVFLALPPLVERFVRART